jgi:hypothetical protein
LPRGRLSHLLIRKQIFHFGSTGKATTTLVQSSRSALILVFASRFSAFSWHRLTRSHPSPACALREREGRSRSRHERRRRHELAEDHAEIQVRVVTSQHPSSGSVALGFGFLHGLLVRFAFQGVRFGTAAGVAAHAAAPQDDSQLRGKWRAPPPRCRPHQPQARGPTLAAQPAARGKLRTYLYLSPSSFCICDLRGR